MADQESKTKDSAGKTNASQSDATAKSNGKSGDDKVWIGFDLGGTKMLAAVYDSNFKQLARSRKKTKGHEGEKAVIARILDNIKSVIESSGVDSEQIAGIGIGCPGPINTANGTVIEAPNLGWNKVPIRKILKDEFNTKAVVCNDVDAGVYGEYRFGSAKDANCAVGIFPGTGVGGGCVYEGKIFQGRSRSCMEIGHIPICSDSVMDGAGNSGTLESVASRLSIAASLAQASYRGQTPALHKRAGTNLADIRSGAIAESFREDQGIAKEIVQQAGEHISLAIVTLIHLLGPDVIVLGGGLVEALPEFFLEFTQQRVKKRILDSFVDTYDIRIAKLGDDATVMGAAAWAKHLAGVADKVSEE